MKKYILAIACVLTALTVLTGCGAGVEQATDSGQSSSAAAESQSAQGDALFQLNALKDGDYTAMRDFANKTIPTADPALAGEIVQALITASEKQLTAASDYIYSEAGAAAQTAVAAAAQSTFGKQYTFICADDKAALLKALPDGNEKKALEGWLAQGLCLMTAEGSYYFGVDYPEYEAAYGAAADAATADFLKITAAQTSKPLTTEEYLAVSPNELGERALAYESFLAKYPEFPLGDTMRILLNTAVYKLSFPSPFDNLVDQKGHIVPEMLVVYGRLAQREDCPAVQAVAQGVLDFVAAQPDGVVCKDYDTDALFSQSQKLTEAARQKIAQRYGEVPE